MPSSVPCQAYAVARFSRWLQQGGVRLEAVDESTVRRFLNRDPGVVHYPEPATIRRLVLMLREIGVLNAATPQLLTSVQECVKEYRVWSKYSRDVAARGPLPSMCGRLSWTFCHARSIPLGTPFGLCDGPRQPRVAAAQRILDRRESHPPSPPVIQAPVVECGAKAGNNTGVGASVTTTSGQARPWRHSDRIAQMCRSRKLDLRALPRRAARGFDPLHSQY